jgi:hypothetical protein
MKHANKIMMIGLMMLMGTGCSGSRDVTSSSDQGASTAAAAQQPVTTASTTDGAILDACSLVAQADADAVLGAPGKLSEHEKDDKFALHCNYEALDQSSGVNNFGVEIHTDEDAADAKQGQTMKKGMYSNITLYDYQVLSGIGDDAFLAVSKPPSAALASGPLASMVAHQQVLMLSKGSKDIEIIVSYTGKERSADGLKVLAKKLADHI